MANINEMSFPNTVEGPQDPFSARKADPITELVNQLAVLPGIGEKTATRLAFFILKAPQDYTDRLGEAIAQVKQRIRLCEVCCNLTEESPCQVCRSQRRDRTVVCVVSSPQDQQAIEATGEFNGLYHVLHGVIAPLEGIGPDELKFRELFQRLADSHIDEVIAATSPSVEGEATALYIKRLLAPLGLTVTRIASGLPMGSHVEHADKVTLGRSISGRHPF